MRVAAAIAVDALAFAIWDLGGRSPARLLRDILAGVKHAPTLIRGLLSFAVGLLLVLGSFTVLRPLLVPADALRLLLVWAALTALLVVELLGGRRTTRDA